MQSDDTIVREALRVTVGIIIEINEIHSGSKSFKLMILAIHQAQKEIPSLHYD